MNPLDFLNANPALVSIVAFPVGVVFLMGALKVVGADPGAILKALQEHNAAELKIEERIKDAVEAIKNFATTERNNRQYYERQMTNFNEKLEGIKTDLTIMLSIAKKRKSDWLTDPNTEVFRDRAKVNP